MRVIYCLLLMLTACTSHAVRCDGHLQPVNPPSARPVSGDAATGAGLHVTRSAR